MTTVGLVTTFRFAPSEDGDELSVERCWSVLSSFLLFHLAKGIDHIFLYADADDHSDDVYIDRVAKAFRSSQVSVDVRNEAQIERQRATCRLWRELGSFCATEVPARQSLNAEDALRKAADIGLHWLLHLDIDELFYTSEASIKPHFDRLSSLGVDQMTYVNHEAVPTRETVNDYFSEIELFRVNHLVLPLSHEVGECTRFWRQKRQHGQYMLAYDNGKSAVRVLPGRIVPQSVHRWRTLRFEEHDASNETHSKKCPGEVVGIAGSEASGKPTVGISAAKSGAGENCRIQPASAEGIDETGHKASSNGQLDEGRKGEQAQLHPPLANRSALADPRELRFEEILECSDPCVLHYPCCGLDWLRDKYRLLGSFPSSWFGGKLPIAPCFHLDARDALDQPKVNGSDSGLATRCSANELDAGRELYRREVMLCPVEYSEQMHSQLKHGVLRSISGAASIIKQIRGAGVDLDPAATPPIASGQQQVEQLNTMIFTQRLNHDALGLHPQMMAQKVPFSSESHGPTFSEIGVDDKEGDATSMPALDNGAPTAADAVGSGFDNSWILAAVAREYL